jgi:hypothetical protein
MSVETGGFEKRPPTQYVANLSFLDNTKEYSVHPIDRTETEQDFILIDPATPSIFAVNAITGAQKTVTVGDSDRYFEVETVGINSTGVTSTGATQVARDSGETTFDWQYKMSDAATVFKLEGSVDGVVWNDIATGKTSASGSFSTTVDAVATGDHNYIRVNITGAAGTASDTITLWATFQDMTYLINADPEDLQMSSVADWTFIVNRNVLAALREADSGTLTGTVQQFSDLAAPTGTGNIYKVSGKDTDGFGAYYVQDDTTTSTWLEIVDPTAHNNFDPSTMPHQLVRAADGSSYTFSSASWDARPAGDETLNPAPGYIGRQIADVGFYRNRLVLPSEEIVYLSQSGDVFNMWAAKATDVLDSDPLERAATTTNVNLLQFVATFRKLLFLSSGRAQFELESGANPLTPETALMSPATTYTASLIAKPKSMGDVLHFCAKTEGSAVVYEYFFQDTSLSNTGVDITRHIRTYIENDLYAIASDPTSTTLFALSTAAQHKLYIYRTFFEGQQKIQSSWGEYTFGTSEATAFIHGFTVFSNFVTLIIERDDGNIYLEQMPIERESRETGMPFMPQVDQRDELTGTYDSTNDETFWETVWEHNDDASVVIGSAGAIPGRTLQVSYPSKYLLTLASVAAGETLIIGETGSELTFTAHATTTTTANREFDISGNDVADAGELTTVLNDTTDGLGLTHLATDNGDGTVTIVPLDMTDTDISAPTGTAVTNATVTATQVKNLVAARGDHSAAAAFIGRDYTMDVELSKIWPRENDVPITTGRMSLKDVTVLYEKTGYFKIVVQADGDRPEKSYIFEGTIVGDADTAIDSPSVAEVGTFGHKKIMAKADTVQINIQNDTPEPCVITSLQWRGFFNETGRAG